MIPITHPFRKAREKDAALSPWVRVFVGRWLIG